MNLQTLLFGLAESIISLEISGIAIDSRYVKLGDAFFALAGSQHHGFEFAKQAEKNGAAVVIFDPVGTNTINTPSLKIPLISIHELDKHLGEIAARFYGYPSVNLEIIGITGTNGKTSCSHLFAQAYRDCGVIGTLGFGDIDNLLPLQNTTPDAITIQHILRNFANQHKRAVVMEVSSHGLAMGRVNSVLFKGAVFTNLSHDHLDYHQTMDSYFQAKLQLFIQPQLKFAVVNLDDIYADRLVKTLDPTVQIWTYSTTGKSIIGAECILADNVSYHQSGISFSVKWRNLYTTAFTPLTGKFNLENSLAVLGMLLAMKIEFHDAVSRLANFKNVNGRMECIGGQEKPTVIIDYAHTPDALEKALRSIPKQNQIYLVFGCGGDRDQTKRSEMGRIASALADYIIITDDNPRSELPSAIIKQILAGCDGQNVEIINDRKLAIQTAIKNAKKQDSVLIAGKGHEEYQEINGVKLPFSDREVAEKALAVWSMLQ